MVIGGHAHSGYDAALTDILSELTLMGRKADALLGMYADALDGENAAQADAKLTDKEVNRLEYDISEQLHFILTRYTPSVPELRFLTAMIKIAGSLERIGDIAKLAIDIISDLPLTEKFQGEAVMLHGQLTMVRQMLASSLENLPDYDPEKMIIVVQKEKLIVGETNELLQQFLQKTSTEKLTDTEVTSDMLQLIRSNERLADHVMDVLRMSFYAHTGKRLKRKKLLKTS